MTYAIPEGQQLILDTTVATLRQVAEWMPARVTRAVLVDLAEEVASADVENWTVCPVCEEVTCDEDCAIRVIRETYESAVERPRETKS